MKNRVLRIVTRAYIALMALGILAFLFLKLIWEPSMMSLYASEMAVRALPIGRDSWLEEASPFYQFREALTLSVLPALPGLVVLMIIGGSAGYLLIRLAVGAFFWATKESQKADT